MNLTIDGRNLEPRPGQSLLEIIRELELDSECLSRLPYPRQGQADGQQGRLHEPVPGNR